MVVGLVVLWGVGMWAPVDAEYCGPDRRPAAAQVTFASWQDPAAVEVRTAGMLDWFGDRLNGARDALLDAMWGMIKDRVWAAVKSLAHRFADAVKNQLHSLLEKMSTPRCEDVPPSGCGGDAGTIVAVGQRLGVAPRGQLVALTAARQESGLRNVPYGDRDSLGLFQQRPSQGWGSAAQVMDPVYAAGAFYRALADVPGWESMLVGAAAQAVQRSAYPGRYAAHVGPARDLLHRLSAGCGTTMPVESCPGSEQPSERGLTPPALRLLRCGVAAFPAVTETLGVGPRPNPSDHPAGRAVDFMIPDWDTSAGNALGWRLARWAQEHAAELDVTYLVWDGRIWSTARVGEGWRPYRHPNGATANPTLRHLDHVHASVRGEGRGAA